MLRVLMIEDNEDDYLLVSNFVAKFGDIQLEWRDSLKNGLAYLELHPVDLLLLDMALPDGYGLAMLDPIQAGFPALPIIVLSGDDRDELALESVRRGAQDYLVKGRVNAVTLGRALRYAVERKRLEDRLRQSEDQFRSAFNHAAIGMALVSLDGRWLQANHALCGIVGYTEPELLTKTFQDITHPDDLDIDLDYVRQMLTGEIESYQMEKRYFHKLGHEVWVLLSVSLVRDSQGQPFQFIAQVQDITPRKRMEAELTARMEEARAFQNYLVALHEITIELTAVDELDEFYKRAVDLGLQRLGFDRLGLLLFDPEASAAVGTYGTDAQGKLVAEHHIRVDPTALTSILYRSFHKEERFALDEHTQLFSDLQPIGMGWNAAAVLWNGTEKLGWLAIDNGVQHLPMMQTQLNMLALYALTLGTLLGKKRSQLAVQESERHLRLLAQNSPDMIYILDLSARRATYLNRTEFLGYPQHELESNGSLIHALHPDDKARVLAHWQEMISDGKRDTVGMIEYRLQDKVGQWHWIQSRETVFGSTADEKPTQILVTLTVTTERKRAEQQAQELATERERVQILSDFIRDTSHDFRTPLSIINTNLYILSKVKDPEKQKTSVEKAERQISRLTQLIDRLLIMARLDSEAYFAFERIDVNQVIANLCVRLDFDATQKAISILPSLWDGKLMVQADARELNIAFAELGKNAVLYTPPDGTISVRTSRQDNQAVIEVDDTGIGIPSAEFSQIFQRLYRVDKARNTETGGAGLGLSIAKRIVELHQGNITVESAPGEGSVFRVFLPLDE